MNNINIFVFLACCHILAISDMLFKCFFVPILSVFRKEKCFDRSKLRYIVVLPMLSIPREWSFILVRGAV